MVVKECLLERRELLVKPSLVMNRVLLFFLISSGSCCTTLRFLLLSKGACKVAWCKMDILSLIETFAYSLILRPQRLTLDLC